MQWTSQPVTATTRLFWERVHKHAITVTDSVHTMHSNCDMSHTLFTVVNKTPISCIYRVQLRAIRKTCQSLIKTKHGWDYKSTTDDKLHTHTRSWHHTTPTKHRQITYSWVRKAIKQRRPTDRQTLRHKAQLLPCSQSTTDPVCQCQFARHCMT